MSKLSYRNSSVALTPLSFREEPLSHLIQLAAKSSEVAYENTGISSLEQPTAVSVGSTLSAADIAVEASKASLDGTIKACAITSRTAAEDQILVVAIRGTVSLVDWLVNFDGDLEPTGEFLVCPQICPLPNLLIHVISTGLSK